MIELRLLHNALVLAEHRNFGRAAKALNISQPTLSRSIQLLEEMMGGPLFDRNARDIVPTPTGKIMLQYAHRIIATSNAMEEEIGMHQGLLDGSLKIGSGPYPGCAIVARTIARFQKCYPGIDIRVTVDDWVRLSDSMLQSDFDFVIIETSQLGTSRDIEIIELNQHPGLFFCRTGHPLLERETINASHISRFPMIRTEIPARLQEVFDKIFYPGEKSGASLRKLNHVISSDQALIKTTVSHSDAIGIGTFGTLEAELDAGMYAVLPIRICGFSTFYNIVKRKNLTASPAARAFMKMLVETDMKQTDKEVKLVTSLGPEIIC